MKKTGGTSDEFAAHPRDVPEVVSKVLTMVAERPHCDAAIALLQILAAVAHPDYLCNLATLDAMSKEQRDAVLNVISDRLTCGWTEHESLSVVRLIEPLLLQSIGTR